jgi:hypothetical protein
MAVTCGIALTLLLLQRWVLAPTFRVAALLGLGTAIALVSKFSALLFLPVGAAAIMAVTSLGRRDRLVRQLLVVAVACFLVTWSVYRFSFARLSGHHYDIVQVWVETHPRLAAVGPYVGAVPLPMPELFAGIAQTFIHNGWGHEGYLFGETSKRGWWFYFPTAIAVKTPIAFLLLSLAAPLIVGRRDRIWLGPLLAALAITIASLFTNINIGVRHVLPVYPLLAVSSGCALAMLWPRRRTLVTLVLLTEAIVSARAHPDYLAYFNAFAGREPHRVLADSNLDWGQDLLRLASRTRERDVDALHLLYYGNADPQRHGLPPLRPPVAGDPGWWAVSETHIALFRDQTAWLDRYPYERVGTSFRLYRVPGGTAVTTRP